MINYSILSNSSNNERKTPKTSTLIIIIVLLLSILGGIIGFITYSSQGAKAPVLWCVQRITEEDLFEENNIKTYAFSYQDVTYVNQDTEFEPEPFKNIYLINMIYNAMEEEWLCIIDYQKTLFSFVKEKNINDIRCFLLERKEI